MGEALERGRVALLGQLVDVLGREILVASDHVRVVPDDLRGGDLGLQTADSSRSCRASPWDPD